MTARFDPAVPFVPRGAVSAEGRRALATSAVSARRDGLARFHLSGPGRVTSLQALVTADVEGAGEGAYLFGALLTPKGMIVAPLWITRLGDTILVEVPVEGAAAVHEVFTRSIPPRLCRAQDVTKATAAIGLFGPQAQKTLAAAAPGDPPPVGRTAELRAGETRIVASRIAARGLTGFDLVVPAQAAEPLLAALRWHGAAAAEPALVEERRILAGFPRLGAEIDERTIPQEVRLDDLGGVSYTKGCYVGQETVARVRFRGHPNRQLVGLALGEAVPPALPERIVDGGRDLGRLTSAAWCEQAGQYLGLAVVRREIQMGATLALSSGADALVHPLPWPDT